jgi:4-amino-4-deoxy-L-arabinose transferase-like glycosyltransferase
VNSASASATSPSDVTAPAPASAEAGGRAGTDEDGAGWLALLSTKVPTERAAATFVAVLGALLFLPFLGTLGLWDPWETHYGEVARAMIQRDDFVYPYWESAYFFSKPALPLWMMAFGFWITGAEAQPPEAPLGEWAEWGARFPFAFVATLTLWAVYRLGSQLRGRVTGVVAAVVLASCPQFIFIGKQTMVDMPYVGLLTLGMALFALAVFDVDDDGPATPVLRRVAALGLAVATFPQLALIGRELSGAGLAGIAAGAVVAGGYVAYVLTRASRRTIYLLGFYACLGLSALSKGLAPLAVFGPVLILYMVFSTDLWIIHRSKPLLTFPMFLLVATPWYLTLSLFGGRDDEGLTFRERFWMHDNFSRVGAGVHGDRGGVGYFFEQLAYAMFPWSAVAPLAIGLAARELELFRSAGEGVPPLRRALALLLGLALSPLLLIALVFRPAVEKLRAYSAPEQVSADDQRRRLMLFVLIWALWGYVFFTVSQTKFHHYVFPALPPLAVLVAGWVTWALEAPRERLGRGTAFVVLALFAVTARDLIDDPQNLVNLFTYKYDRDYPRDIPVRPFVGGIVGVGAAAMLAAYVAGRRSWALAAFVASAVTFGAWVSHHHFNYLSPHWGQAHLFKTYFAQSKVNTTGDGTKTREPIYAYQLNWRGETFYSRNRILQVKEKGANERMRELVDRPGREFIIVEQSRFQTLKGILSADKRDKLEILDRSNNKFYLCVVQE